MENRCFRRIHIFRFFLTTSECSSRKSNYLSSIITNGENHASKKSIFVWRDKNTALEKDFFTESFFLQFLKNLSWIATISDSPCFYCFIRDAASVKIISRCQSVWSLQFFLIPVGDFCVEFCEQCSLVCLSVLDSVRFKFDASALCEYLESFTELYFFQ